MVDDIPGWWVKDTRVCLSVLVSSSGRSGTGTVPRSFMPWTSFPWVGVLTTVRLPALVRPKSWVAVHSRHHPRRSPLKRRAGSLPTSYPTSPRTGSYLVFRKIVGKR